MTTHGSYSEQVRFRAPQHAPGAAAQSYYPSTYASAAYPELAASACPPQVAKRPQSVARVRSQDDRALFSAVRSALKPAQLREALSNVCFVVGLILFAISGPLAILTFFVMLFIEF